MHKTIPIVAGFIVFALVGFYLVSRFMIAQNTNLPEVKEQILGEEIQKEADVVVPNGLLNDCSQYFKQEGQAYQTSCETYPKATVCSYYSALREGQQTVQNLQYSNACAACRFYGETGERTIGTTHYKQLGYTESSCE